MNARLRRMAVKLRGALMVLLFLPFVALQTLAQGTMPAAGPDGIRLVLCTGGDVVSVVMRADGSVTPVEDDHADIDCPWAVSHVAAISPAGPDTPGVPMDVVPVKGIRSSDASEVAAFALAPPVRAPPLSV